MKAVRTIITTLYFLLSISTAFAYEVEIPNYVKNGQNIEQEIDQKAEKATELVLKIGVAILFVAFVIGAALIGTGFKKDLGIQVCVASVAGALLLVLGDALLSFLMTA